MNAGAILDDHFADLNIFKSLAIYAPWSGWHWEVWGFALQFAVASDFTTVHFHVRNATNPRGPQFLKGGEGDWQHWQKWVTFYRSQGLFPSKIEIKVDAAFFPSEYDFVIVPTDTEQWEVPRS